MNLGDIIKKYRKDHGLSMDKFSEISGLSKGYISMLEKNQHPRTGNPIAPSLETFMAVANALAIDLNELIEMLDGTQAIEIKGGKINDLDNITNLNDTSKDNKKVKGFKIPVLGHVAAHKDKEYIFNIYIKEVTVTVFV